MANAAAAKGADGERECVRAIQRIAPHLCVEDPMRMLGAGRKDDVGDLRVFDDAVVQVKRFKAGRMSQALNQAAAGAARQAVNARMPFEVGLVCVPGAKRDGSMVRWVAVAYEWPVTVQPFRHRSATEAMDWVVLQGVDRRDAVIRVERAGVRSIVLGSLETWLAGYEQARAARDGRLAAA